MIIRKLGRKESEQYISVMRHHIPITSVAKQLAKGDESNKDTVLKELDILKYLLTRQLSNERKVLKQASSVYEAESREKLNDAIDRFVNEGGNSYTY